MKIFGIKDDKHGTYQRIFTATHVGEAIRAAGMALQDGKSVYAQYAEDFSLWEMGDFLEESGQFVTPPPHHVVNFVSLLRREDPQ